MKTRSLERKSVSAAAIYIPRGSETPLKMEDRPTAVHNTPFCLTFVQIHRWSPRNIRSLFITLQTRYRSRHEQLSPFCDILLKLVRTLEKALSSSLSPCFFSGRISDRIETGRRAITWFARRGGGGGGALEKIHCGCRCGRLEKVVCRISRVERGQGWLRDPRVCRGIGVNGIHPPRPEKTTAP